MVSQVGSPSSRTVCILLAPNQSLSLSGNLWVLISLLGVSLAISIGFAFAGAWVILPFAGLELLLLFVLFSYVYMEGTRQEVIRINRDRVVLDRRRGYRQQTVYRREFARSSLAVFVRMGDSPADPASLSFSGPEGCLEVGSFLTDKERAELVQKLSQCGIYARREKSYRLQKF